MKKIIIAFLIIALLLLAGCETKEEREAREQAERERQEAHQKQQEELRIQKQKERIEREKKIEAAIDECSQFEDTYNQTECLFNTAMEIGNADELCGSLEDPDMCYFYYAVAAEKIEYCAYTEDQIACALLSDEDYCTSPINDFDNKGNCMAHQADIMKYYDLREAMNLCSRASRYKTNLNEFNCKEVDFTEMEEYMEDPLEDRLWMVYVYAILSDYQIETTYR
jgi:hypothetical protein